MMNKLKGDTYARDDDLFNDVRMDKFKWLGWTHLEILENSHFEPLNE
jgi:hypothetical protein